jgi:glutamate--cysteine ligase
MNQSPNKPWSWLSELFKSNIRKASERRIGLEVEQIAAWKDGSPFLYRTSEDGKRPGAKDLLEALERKFQWKCVRTPAGEIVGLELPDGKVSLEPGSQVEFAVHPQEDLQKTEGMISDFSKKIDEVIKNWPGLFFLETAVNPVHRMDELDLIPSERYVIMDQVLSRTGIYGTTMMRRTCSVQINLDYTSEEEAIEMLRTSLLVAPVSTALFANSPILEGKPTGFLSTRAEIWRNTDPSRTGLLPEAFKKGFNFDSYAEYLWKLPLMFVQNDEGHYVNAKGNSLKTLSEGAFSGVSANQTNMRSAVQQLFTEGRLKPGYVEVRSVDGQPPHSRMIAAAFWTGLLYSPMARQLAFDLLGHLSSKELDQFWELTSRKGLKAEFLGMQVQAIADKLLQKSKECLIERGKNEEKYL